MRLGFILIGTGLLAACGASPTPAADAANSADPERAALARRADTPDFSAVDALANGAAAPAATPPANTDQRPDGAPSAMPVVTDPVAGIEAAIGVSSRGDDGLKSLPLAPDLLVALRRTEARGEVGAYDHDFLVGAQEALPVRGLSSTTRRTGAKAEVTSRFVVEGVGPRTLVSRWSPRGDGSWQLDDLAAEGTTLSALLAAN